MSEKYELENYERFLGDIKEDIDIHWAKMEKRTATLFQVLIDGDLKELVFVLKNYPKYISLTCEHFRYLYNYSEQVADIYAASELLDMTKEYHTKQFIRNLIRKLQKIDDFDISEIKTFLKEMIENQDRINDILISYYKSEIQSFLDNSTYHKIQIKIIEKELKKLTSNIEIDFNATDRDANLDIPYIN